MGNKSKIAQNRSYFHYDNPPKMASWAQSLTGLRHENL